MAEANPAIRERVERFSLLRGAQRALARCMHPVALDPLREQGRQLLIQLQAAGREASPARGEAALGEIDRLLGHHLGQTLELLGRLEFAQLRTAGPELCRDKPEELRALLDVILLGDLADDREIRLVEYLITMLCVEDEDGRRSQVREPSELTEALQGIARLEAADASIDAGAAAARLEEAARSLIRGSDHGDLRDEIRGFKQELGARLLHPEILAAAVAYNVAMANQVSARIDSTLGLDQLADDLLTVLQQPEVGDSDLLHGRGMTRLAAALRSRVCGAPSEDATACHIVAAFRLDGLVAREVEALEDPDEDGLDGLIVSAVVLGCVLRQRAALASHLEEIGLDPEVLESDALPALLREMGAASSKFFADGSHSEAFLISEVKTRNLAAIHAAVERRARSTGGGPSRGSGAGVRWRLPFGLSPGLVGLVVGPLLGLVFGAMFFSPFENDVRIFSTNELSEISPFLDSGHERIEQGELRFVGHLFPTWDYLGTPEREAIAHEVTSHFTEQGVNDGVLLGVGPRVMVRWEDGDLVELASKPAD